jgi:hypothetical protein
VVPCKTEHPLTDGIKVIVGGNGWIGPINQYSFALLEFSFVRGRVWATAEMSLCSAKLGHLSGQPIHWFVSKSTGLAVFY